MRPEILFPLFAPVTSLKGVGSRVAPLLERIGGPVVRDVLFLSPQRIVRRPPATIASATEGEIATFQVVVESHQRPGRSGRPWKIRVFDDTGFMTLVFFHGAGPDLERRHPRNAHRVVSGRLERERFGNAPQIVHPDYLVAPEQAGAIPKFEGIRLKSIL